MAKIINYEINENDVLGAQGSVEEINKPVYALFVAHRGDLMQDTNFWYNNAAAKKTAEMWNTLYSSPGFIEVRTIRIY